MARKLFGWLAVLLALSGLTLFLWSMIGTAGAATAQTEDVDPVVLPTLPPFPEESPRRESDGAVDPSATLISFIDSPTAECYRPQEFTNVCYIQWQYLNVTASTSQYIISMTVSIDSQLRAYYSGFFQTSMYVDGNMMSPGFQVACGALGVSGNPQLGKAYSYTIRARETGGLKSANYGTAYCPADELRMYLPLVRR
jgi:hypothetical protein